jgi:hypothetical protein
MGDTAPAVSWETQLPGAERGLPHLKSELWGTRTSWEGGDWEDVLV